MIDVGTEVMIHPAFTLHFGGRWGVVIEIETELSEVPYLVSFGGNRPFRFGRQELMTRTDYEKGGEIIPCPICSNPVEDMKEGYCNSCIRRRMSYGY